MGEAEAERSEVEYLQLLRRIRDEQPDLFAVLKRLPKKARAGWQTAAIEQQNTLTFFRQGRIKKFFACQHEQSRELTLFQAIDLLQCEPTTPRLAIPPTYYEQLVFNKLAFAAASRDEERKLVLDTLTRFPSAQGLRMITPHLKNSSLSEDASKAAVTIGEKIVDNDPKSVADAMTKVIAATKNEEIAKRANVLIARTK